MVKSLTQKLNDINFCAIPYRIDFSSGLHQPVMQITSSSNGTKLGKGSIFCANLCQDKAYHVQSDLPAHNTDAIRQAFGPPSQPSQAFSGFITNSILYWHKNGPPHSAGPLGKMSQRYSDETFLKSIKYICINQIHGFTNRKD
jgi:hypothetical protein